MATISFAISLLIVAVVLGGFEWVHYRSVLAEEDDADLLRVSHAQFRRRMLVSGVIVLVAAMMAAGTWVPGNIAGLIYWCIVAALTCGVIGLAAADFQASRRYLSQLKQDQQAQYDHLMQEIDKFKQSQEGDSHDSNAESSGATSN